MNRYFKGYITRENAVRVLCRETCHPGPFCPDSYCVEMWEKFKDIPNEDVAPVKRGEWKRFAVNDREGRRTGEHKIVCSECGHAENIWHAWDAPNYCSSCGANMREGENHEKIH